MSAAAASATIWPTELRFRRATKTLEIDFDNGETLHLPAELLRVETPSAERRGHGPAVPQIVAGKRHVSVTRIEPVGNYAARIVFDDGHASGLYSWRFLHALGARRAAAWQAYLATLAGQGLSRDP